jgi:hypothetical protein
MKVLIAEPVSLRAGITLRNPYTMAAYDSDSSGGEDNDYTETNVLLGYASKDESEDTLSYLGGRPVSSGLL